MVSQGEIVPVFTNLKKPEEDFHLQEKGQREKIAFSIRFARAIAEA